MFADSKAGKFHAKVQDEGLVPALEAVVFWLRMKTGFHKKNPVEAHRLALANKLDADFASVVRYGPFKGMKLSTDGWWISGERASMLLGFYEDEVLDALMHLPERYRLLVDLGAADGYYGIGAVFSGRFDRSWCFEIEARGREVIAREADANGVANKVLVRGEATPDFHAELTEDERRHAVLLVDIEGGEFGLLDQGTFEAFRHAAIIIEVNPWMVDDGAAKLGRLKADAAATHHIETLTTGARNLSAYPELGEWNDTDRWLIASEGRGQLMQWLKLMPKQPAAD